MNNVERLKGYLLFSIAIIIGAYMCAMASVAISGERGYAGLITLIALPVIQLTFSFKFVDTSIIRTVLIAIVVSTITHFASLAAKEVEELRLGLDHYGYLDFLVIYIIISILAWEVVRASISMFKSKNM